MPYTATLQLRAKVQPSIKFKAKVQPNIKIKAQGLGEMISVRVSLSSTTFLNRGAIAFSPYSLFTFGTQGIWLDPSDLTTMYQDAAGTTPVTTPGQPVGLRLDKSKGLVLGAEIVANGDFATGDLTGFTSGGGWAVVDNVARLNSNNGAFYLRPTVSNTNARWMTFTVVSGSTGSIDVRGTSPAYTNILTINSPGTYTVFIPAGTEINFLRTSLTFNGGLDNISVRELAGNHATQSVLASRPTYGIEPAGGRRNLLTYSEDLTNAAWTKGGGTATADTTIAPDGTLTADTLTPLNSWVAQGATSGVANQTASGSIWVYPPVGVTSVTIRIDRAGIAQGNQTVKTVTPQTWQRLTHTATLDANTVAPVLRVDLTGGATLAVWGAQLELGSTATPYQRVTTAFDVTEAGVQSCHYVQYDGSDDGMITNSIDFTATDKMSVFAGVRKLSDAATGMLLELSTSANAGSFYQTAPQNTSGSFGASSRGSAADVNGQRSESSAVLGPLSALITATHDISGDLTTQRITGIAQSNAVADKGTGTFGNYPLYLGRRGGTTLPFNGRDYGIVVVGKATTAAEITSTESWMAGKTGFYAPIITGVPTIGVS